MNEHAKNMGPASNELLDLLWELHEGTLSAERAERLSEMLASDEKHRHTYVAFMEIIAELEWSHAGNDAQPFDLQFDDDTDKPLPAPVESPSAVPLPIVPTAAVEQSGLGSDLQSGSLFSGNWVRGPFSIFALCVVVVAAAIGTLAIFLRPYFNGREAIAVAKLQSNRHCVWAGERDSLAEGTALFSGERFELLEGIAGLNFGSGATVLVESPADFEVSTSNSLRLHSGTVVVRANGAVKDFIVASPDASIVDLGTSFGVHYDKSNGTEVEVFEGAVEVYPDETQPSGQRVLGIGASARVARHGNEKSVDTVASEVDRFANLLELLWADMSQPAGGTDDQGGAVVAEFSDAPIPGTVDTFYGAVRGRGWLTPWVAAGNPTAHISTEDPLSGPDNPYLRLRFYRSYERAIARQYGERAGFDPTKPHVISWRWRFDGNLDHFGSDFWDRVYFYSNPHFRRNSWPTNGWLIGVAGGDDPKNKRQVFPKRWYAFDGHDGQRGKDFDKRNMVDTGMELKAGVIYRFAVVVYPEIGRYDVAIRDDKTTFTKTGLRFRNPELTTSNVIHFGASANTPTDDFSFSVDSIRIEPLEKGGIQDHVQE